MKVEKPFTFSLMKQISIPECPNVIPNIDTPHTLSKNDPRHVFIKTVSPERKNSIPKNSAREEVPTLLAHVKVSERASNFKKSCSSRDVDVLSLRGNLGKLFSSLYCCALLRFYFILFVIFCFTLFIVLYFILLYP